MAEQPLRVLRRNGVKRKFGNDLPDSTLDGLIESANFPRPIRLGARTVAWFEHEIDAWLKARAAERDARLAGPA